MASVDVVIPSYQYGRYLRDCVTSVLRQDVEKLRVLVIDNASTDGSAEIARELAREDPRVDVVARRTNLGPHASYNEGIDWAEADYFLILCADDLLVPGCLRRAVSVMERHPGVCMTYGRDAPLHDGGPMPVVADRQDAEWRIISGGAFIERFCRTAVFDIPGSTLVVRTAAQKQAGHYRPELPHTDDYDIWLRLACLGDVAETDAVQGILRHHVTSRSAFIRDAHNWHVEHTSAAVETFFAHEGAHLPGARRLHRMARRSLAGRAYWSAAANLVRGRGRVGLDLLKLACRIDPSTAVLPPVDYLYRRPGALDRVARVARDALGWPRVSSRSIPSSG
ncbi:glycosyltransferase family A protein [Arenibaculum pallidiluteum]|uniref:glycosyltransferase family A protein n=1 Tax=Arenibaculum pallidiluteum TaxID=2812559 RepID=UPI001A95A029|nr:glycosyltransferase family A protein [Arenibaculum pallidiluteum]